MTNNNNISRFPFITATAHTAGKDFGEGLYYVRYSNTFIDDLWMSGVNGDLVDKDAASVYSLSDAKSLALWSVNMDPSFDSNAVVLDALTGEVVFDASSYLCMLIDREICYTVYECGTSNFEQDYEHTFTFDELCMLNQMVDIYQEGVDHYLNKNRVSVIRTELN